jgi:hypothetical protein
MKDILPSMPKGEIVGDMAIAEMTQMVKVVIEGEIVGDMAIAEMTQMVKVVIDGNRLFLEHAQVMEHKKTNTHKDC